MKSQYTFSIGRVEKEFSVDWGKYPENVQEYFIQYGLKKGFNDRLAPETMDAFRALEGNANKTQNDFVEYTMGLVGNIHSRMLKGEVSAPRQSGGGSLFGEVRAILKANYAMSAKILAAIRNAEDLLGFCRIRTEGRLKESGQKYAKQNVEYGAGKLHENIMRKAAENIASRGDLDEPDLNDIK